MTITRRPTNSQLEALAKQKSLKVPDAPDLMHRASLKMLQAKSGAGFDESYISQMHKDHDKAMTLFQEAVASGKVDPELKALASKTLPILEKHHQLVSQLAAEVVVLFCTVGSGQTRHLGELI